MPLYKTFSGADKQIIKPKEWTYVTFQGKTEIPIARFGWSMIGILLRVEYPLKGSPKILSGRFARWPDSPREDTTGFDDKTTFPGENAHHYWSHFIKGQKDLTLGFKIWHNGTAPIVLDGRQFKWVRFLGNQTA